MNTEKIIAAHLAPYKDECRFLKTFICEDKIGKATFEINSDFYCHDNHPVHYFSAAEMQICVNQMLYIYCVHIGVIPFDEDANLDKEYIQSLAAQKFITEQSCNFKSALKTSQPILAEMEEVFSRKIGNRLLIECKFKFEESCFGKVKVLIQFP